MSATPEERRPRQHRRVWYAVALLGLAAALLGTATCNSPTPPILSTEPSSPGGPVVPSGPPFFRDVTADSGVQYTYQNGQEFGHLAILESLGGGIALIDYDGDGLLDVFVLGGGSYDKDKKTYDAELEKYQKDPSGPAPVPPAILGRPGKLFRNLGNFKFRDVTAEVGLDKALAYTHGAAVCDYDRDGWPDLLVTGWGRLALYHNEPDGKGGRHFVNVTQKAGLSDKSWSSSAAWADFDGDGWPDLYICHYADWSFQNHPQDCNYNGKTPDVCPPKKFSGLPHLVYRNNRDGTFTDVTADTGLRPGGKETSKGLGVVAVDLNGDRKPDVYVANDTVDNFLYMNRSTRGKIRFEEIGVPAGVARDDRGQPNGSMGVAVADLDGNGRPSLWCTNYENEQHALYRNQCIDGREFFTFATQATGIAALGQAYVGWGTAFFDFDHHGYEDLFIVNGHAIRFPTGKAKRAQRPVLMHNVGPPAAEAKDKRQFLDCTARGGSYFATEHVARGVAFGDLDNDGRIDAVISHLNEPVTVLRNEADVGSNHWLGIELIGKEHRDVVGARVLLEVGGRRLSRFQQGGGSYASSSDRRHVFGLGTAEKVGRLTVSWPSGEDQHFDGLAVDRYWRLVQGEKLPQEPRKLP